MSTDTLELAVPPAEPTLESLGADEIMSEIQKHCVVVYVTVSYWKGRRKMRNAEVTINGRTVDPKKRKGGGWCLMPDTWSSRFAAFERRARKAISERGISLKEGIFILPRSRAQTAISEIRAVRPAFQELTEKFLAAWPEIRESYREEILTELGPEVWLQIERTLPRIEDMSQQFGIRVGIWPSAEGNSLLTVQLLARLQEEMAIFQQSAQETLPPAYWRDIENFLPDLASLRAELIRSASCLDETQGSEWLAELQQETRRLVQETAHNLVAEPVQGYVEAVKGLAEKLRSEAICNSGTIDIVRRAHDKLASFSFALPQELVRRLRELGASVENITPQDLNQQNDAALALRDALLGSVQELEEEARALTSLGRMTRRFDVPTASTEV